MEREDVAGGQWFGPSFVGATVTRDRLVARDRTVDLQPDCPTLFSTLPSLCLLQLAHPSLYTLRLIDPRATRSH